SPEAVGWQPVPQVASVGWNLQHLGEMLDHYLAHVFGQGAPDQQGPLLTMRSGAPDDGRYRDLQAIAAYHRRVRPAYRAFLAGLGAAEWARVIERRGKRTVSSAGGVGHIAEHEIYPLGKCPLLRSLLAARASH